MATGKALLQASVGLALGLLAASVAMRGLRAMLFEVNTADPITFGRTVLTVLAVAGLAATIPAVRAMRVDPISALRAE